MSHGAPRRVYQSVGTVRAAVGLTAGTVVFAVLAVAGRAQVAGGILATIVLLAAWRMWIAGIRTERGGIKIVAFFGTRRVAWDDIDHFAVLPIGQFPWVGHVVLRDGDRLPCLAIAAAARPRSERRRLQVQRPINELNEVLRDWRKTAGQQVEHASS